MTSIPKELLPLLACPETKGPVREATAPELALLNEKIRAGAIKNHAGNSVAVELSAGLISVDNARIYPVRDGIPIMLVEESMDCRPITCLKE